MTGSRVRRRTGAILATALFTISLVPGLASAANTRTLWIGSPDAQTNAGKISSTPVTVPAASPAPQHMTLFDVQIKSTDNQTLAHTVLTITIANYPGLNLNSYTQTDFCDDDGRVITCDFGNLEGLGSRTVSVLVDVTSAFVAAGQPATLFSATVITNNENGTNQQLFTAVSGPFPDGDPETPDDPGFQVGPHSDNGLSTFVPPGQLKQLATGPVASGNNLSTNITFTAGARETVRILEGTSTNVLFPCPTTPVVLNCQPDFSQVVTNSGFFEDTPFFAWSLTARVPKTYALSQGFVAHYDTETHSDWQLFFKNKSAFCGTNIPAKIEAVGQCIVTGSLTLSKPVNGFSILSLTVVMKHQGGMKI